MQAEPHRPRHSLGSGADPAGPGLLLQNLLSWSLPESLSWGLALSVTV